jgi:hypothetical protein
MYFTDPLAEDAQQLRQGDIITYVPIFSPIDYSNGIAEVKKGSAKTRYMFETEEKQHCLVISACCEMCKDNNGKAHTVTLAPLRPIRAAGADEVQSKLIKPDLTKSPEGIFRYIWCEKIESIGMQVDGVFDLSCVKV